MVRSLITNQLLRDLPTLCELLSILYERVHSNPLYTDPLCQLIALCGKSFLKERISDENTYTSHVLQTLTLLGQFVAAGEERVAPAIAKAIASFYTEDPNQALLEGKFTYSELSFALVTA